MSSHHVVRDNQEFALIIADGEACSLKLLQELLDWSPLVVVLDEAFYRVHELGIKINVWLGDFDSLENLEEIAKPQMPVEIVHTPDQDKTDFEKGIEYCINRGFQDIRVVWATGKRMDHTFANVTNLVKYQNQVHLVLMDDYSLIFPLPYEFEKWYPAGKAISLVPVSEAHGIKSEGLLYPLNNESLHLGERIGTSNETVKDGPVKISYSSGHLLLMECWDLS